MDDTQLDARLAAMDARAPGVAAGRSIARRTRPRWVALAAAPVMVLALAATATAGAAVVRLATGSPGVENPGQPLAGANLECMTPPEAAAYLAAHGFDRVTWQVESGDAASKTGVTTIVAVAPEHGYVVPGSIVDGTLLMVVDQRTGATGSGACAGEPMP